MDEMEFTEAESNMNDLISEYQQYQVREYQLCILGRGGGLVGSWLGGPGLVSNYNRKRNTNEQKITLAELTR